MLTSISNEYESSSSSYFFSHLNGTMVMIVVWFLEIISVSFGLPIPQRKLIYQEIVSKNVLDSLNISLLSITRKCILHIVDKCYLFYKKVTCKCSLVYFCTRNGTFHLLHYTNSSDILDICHNSLYKHDHKNCYHKLKTQFAN